VFALHGCIAENAALEVVVSGLKLERYGLAGTIRLEGGGEQIMKRKPDILWVLVLVFGLGVVTTGYTQGLWERSDDSTQVPISHSQQLHQR
jgi:hypothetical protein